MCNIDPKESIRKLIIENFWDVKHPGNQNLLFDGQRANDEDEVEFLYKYEGKHWSEIKEENPHQDTESYIAILSNEALLYVIPYLLNLILDDDSGLEISAHLRYMVADWHKPVDLSSGQAMTIYLALNYRILQYESDPCFLPIEDDDPYYHEVLEFRDRLISRYNLKVEY